MYATSLTQPSKHGMRSKTSTVSVRLLANGLSRRSVRQVFEMSLSDDGLSSVPNDGTSPFDCRPVRGYTSRVNVAAIPSLSKSCRHHLFIEDGTRLKKLDLPSTACVAVSQRFQARAGDTLTYDYVILLQSRGGSVVDRPAVRAVIVNRAEGSVVLLMGRSLGGSTNSCQQRVASRFRETQSFTVPASGEYELRFITLVDHNHYGSEAHMLVDSVRVVSSSGQEMSRLASVSCVGRVRQPMLD